MTHPRRLLSVRTPSTVITCPLRPARTYDPTFWANETIGMNGDVPIPRAGQDAEPDWDTIAGRVLQARADLEAQQRAHRDAALTEFSKALATRNQQIARRHAAGESYAAIGRDYNLTGQRVRDVVHMMDVKQRRVRAS